MARDTACWPRSVDALLGQLQHLSRLPVPQQNALKLEMIADAYSSHRRRNSLFNHFCETCGFAKGSIQDVAELERIPLLPIRLFKQTDASLLSVSIAEIEFEVASTGTSGQPSVARRDAITTTRMALALTAQYRDFFAFGQGVALFLCPSPADFPEMGMVKAFGLIRGLVNESFFAVKKFHLDVDAGIAFLRSWKDRQTRHLFGPPFLIQRFARELKRVGVVLLLDRDSFVITLGGWKRHTDEQISRQQFDTSLNEQFGLLPCQVRDMYGLVEANLMAIECEHRRKHVPPWTHLTLRNPDDPTQPARPGQPGVIGVIDPLSNSYPGFLLTDDVGRVEVIDPCPCGRSGQVVKFLHRLPDAEIGCCAVTIERCMTHPDSSALGPACRGGER